MSRVAAAIGVLALVSLGVGASHVSATDAKAHPGGGAVKSVVLDAPLAGATERAPDSGGPEPSAQLGALMTVPDPVSLALVGTAMLTLIGVHSRRRMN